MIQSYAFIDLNCFSQVSDVAHGPHVNNYVDLSDNDVDLSDIKLTSRWQLVALTGYKYKIFSY